MTQDFHKFLEEYFEVMQIGEYNKIFYERRSKQYDRDPLVKPCQKANFRILIQSFVTLFLQKPEEGARHESKLLHEYGKEIFWESQSFKPYYLSAFIFIEIEKFFKNRKNKKNLYTYKPQIAFVLKNMLGGKSGDINKKKDIEKYCDNLVAVLSEKASLEKDLNAACDKFEEIQALWIKAKGIKYQYGIKDSAEFTAYMIKCLDNSNQQKENVAVESAESKDIIYKGSVFRYQLDKYGKYYGYIKHDPENIFFHTDVNPNVDSTYLNKEVWFKIEEKDHRLYAHDIQLFENN